MREEQSMGETRSMRPDDWTRTEIGRGSYFNKEYAITGYRRVETICIQFACSKTCCEKRFKSSERLTRTFTYRGIT